MVAEVKLSPLQSLRMAILLLDGQTMNIHCFIFIIICRCYMCKCVSIHDVVRSRGMRTILRS